MHRKLFRKLLSPTFKEFQPKHTCLHSPALSDMNQEVLWICVSCHESEEFAAQHVGTMNETRTKYSVNKQSS